MDTLGLGTSTSDPYIYVDDQHSLDNLVKHLNEYRTVNLGVENHIFVDCEGNDLGCYGGKLGLVQIGIENDIYLIDVITFKDSIPVLKEILEDEKLVKIFWDARNDFAELWHGHEIHLRPVLDLQLLRVYQNNGWRINGRGWAKLEGMGRTFSNLSTHSRSMLGVSELQFQRMNLGIAFLLVY